MDTVNDSLLPYNLVQLLGELDEEKTEKLTDILLAADLHNQIMEINQPIHLLINSGGGPIMWAWQLCDVMDSLKTPVYTIGTGNIASAALFIFVNGEPGHRVLSKHAAVMSHEFSWGIDGTFSQLKATGVEANNIYKRMVDHFRNKTGLSKKEIMDKLISKNDNWYTATQAKNLNLADKVVSFDRYNPFRLAKEISIEKQIQSRKEQEQREYWNSMIENIDVEYDEECDNPEDKVENENE